MSSTPAFSATAPPATAAVQWSIPYGRGHLDELERLQQQAADPAADDASLEQHPRLSFAEGDSTKADALMQEAERIRTQSRRPPSALGARDAATMTIG